MAFPKSVAQVLAIAAFALGLASGSVADVTLRSADGKVSISGQLVDATAETFVLKTAVGEIRLDRSDVVCEGADCPQVRMVTILADARLGEVVTIAAADASLTISGRLVSFSDQTYGIETEVGQLNIPSEQTHCSGPGCPSEVSVPETSISAALLARIDGSKGNAGHAPAAPTNPDIIAGDQTVALVAPAVEAFTDSGLPEPGTPATGDGAPSGGPSLALPDLPNGADSFQVPTRDGATRTASLDTALSPTPAPEADQPGTLRIAAQAGTDSGLMRALLAAYADANSLAFSADGDTGQLGDGTPFLFVGANEAADLTLGHGNAASTATTRQRLLGFQAHVAVVAPDNAQSQIALSDLRDILGGRLTNWRALGGADAAIRLLALDADTDMAGHATETFADAATLQAALAGDPTALAVLPMADLGAARPLAIQESCGLVRHVDAISVQTGEYPISQPVVLQLAPGAAPLAAEVLDFTASAAARELVAARGLIPVEVIRGSLDARAQDLRAELPLLRDVTERQQLQALVDLMGNSDRLSTVFRFRGTSMRLDDTSRAAIRGLLAHIGDQKITGDIYLIGFSDDVGVFGGNQTQSLRRARAVEEALLEQDINGILADTSLITMGMSELAPVACNQQSDGRALNRRVEVWVAQ